MLLLDASPSLVLQDRVPDLHPQRCPYVPRHRQATRSDASIQGDLATARLLDRIALRIRREGTMREGRWKGKEWSELSFEIGLNKSGSYLLYDNRGARPGVV